MRINNKNIINKLLIIYYIFQIKLERKGHVTVG
jgi:hypothetical protein